MNAASLRQLAAIHLAGNALLLWLGYYWLGIGESRAATVVWSAVVLMVLALTACWLYGATFAYFRGGDSGLSTAFRTALRNLAAVVVAVLAVLALYVLLARWEDSSGQTAFQIASWLTLKLRKPVRPAAIVRIFHTAFWLVRWVVLPVFMLPIVAGAASRGWSGFREAGRSAKKRLYWLEAPILLVCALWVPFQLVGWVPTVGSFVMEILSFAIRILAAYLLFVGAWLLLALLTSAGRPVRSHPRTVASP